MYFNSEKMIILNLIIINSKPYKIDNLLKNRELLDQWIILN